MRDYNLAAIHDRIDEEHFENRMHAQAIDALQRRVNLLEATVRELRLIVGALEESLHGASTACNRNGSELSAGTRDRDHHHARRVYRGVRDGQD